MQLVDAGRARSQRRGSSGRCRRACPPANRRAGGGPRRSRAQAAANSRLSCATLLGAAPPPLREHPDEGEFHEIAVGHGREVWRIGGCGLRWLGARWACLPVLVHVPRRGRPPRRGSCRGALGTGARRSTARPLRPRRPPGTCHASRRCAGSSAPARLPDPARPHRRAARRTARCRTSRVSSQAVGTLGRELRNGGYDVVHVHEPNAPFVSWFATEAARVPAGRHLPLLLAQPAHQRRSPPTSRGARRLYSKLDVRIAVSEAARWTCERFYGGRYRIVPNGVDLAAALPAHHERRRRPARAALRRPRRGAQGPARPAARLRGAAHRRRRRPAHRGRRHRRGGRAAAARPRGRARGRARDRRGEVAPARRGGHPLRPVAGRRELRHGAHGGVRVLDARRGLGHRRLPRRGARRRRRPPGARRGARRARRGAAVAWRSTPIAARAWPSPRASAPSASPGRA